MQLNHVLFLFVVHFGELKWVFRMSSSWPLRSVKFSKLRIVGRSKSKHGDWWPKRDHFDPQSNIDCIYKHLPGRFVRWISSWWDFPPHGEKKTYKHHPPTWITKDDLNSTFGSASLVQSTPVLSGKHLGSTRNLLLQFTHEVGIRGFAWSSLHGLWKISDFRWHSGQKHEQRKIPLYTIPLYVDYNKGSSLNYPVKWNGISFDFSLLTYGRTRFMGFIGTCQANFGLVIFGHWCLGNSRKTFLDKNLWTRGCSMGNLWQMERWVRFAWKEHLVWLDGRMVSSILVPYNKAISLLQTEKCQTCDALA